MKEKLKLKSIHTVAPGNYFLFYEYPKSPAMAKVMILNLDY